MSRRRGNAAQSSRTTLRSMISFASRCVRPARSPSQRRPAPSTRLARCARPTVHQVTRLPSPHRRLAAEPAAIERTVPVPRRAVFQVYPPRPHPSATHPALALPGPELTLAFASSPALQRLDIRRRTRQQLLPRSGAGTRRHAPARTGGGERTERRPAASRRVPARAGTAAHHR